MKKLFGAVLILAIAWAIPPVRMKIGAASLPIIDKLGPLGDRIATPVRRHTAKSQAIHLASLVQSAHVEGRELPDERSFQQWLKRRAPETKMIDPWGQPYWLQRGRGTVTIGSNGVDGRKKTADDVTHTISL